MWETQDNNRRRAELLAHLRTEVGRLESSYTATAPGHLNLPPSVDACFEDGKVPLGAVHEIVAVSREQEAAANGFVAGLLSRLPKSAGFVWITKRRTVFPPGLTMFGLDPDRVVFIELPRERDALWAAEEALRCKAVAAVVADIANVDLTASRRLQLAAEQTGAAAFLLRFNPKALASSACIARWQVRHAASVAPDGLPGVGFPRWDIDLLKVRNGRTGAFTLEWRGNEFAELMTGSNAVSRVHRAAGAA